jgi:lysophospholipase L1-like esterase
MENNNNKYQFARSVAVSLATLVVLLALGHWSPLLPKSGLVGIFRKQVAQAKGRNPFVGQAGNGYYENLMGKNDSTPAIEPLQWIIRGKFPRSVALHSIYQNADFLEYEGRPNLRVPHPEKEPIASGTFGFTEGPIQTNSHGFFDREHTLAKPAGTRRIAILGDSITRGWGVPMNERFSSLLETRLNAQSGEHFEILNFAVTAYTMTQIFDVAVQKAPKSHPDVYVLCLTVLTGSSDWGSHIARLVREHRDLKYDFLRDLVQKAGLRADDSPELSNWKLAPYRKTLLRELLLRTNEEVEAHSARLLVVLVPAVEDRDITQGRLRVLRESLKDTGIPVVDLTDTFDGSSIEALRINWHDVHPNALGHRMLADNLYKKLLQNPPAWAIITGEAGRTPKAATADLHTNPTAAEP